jgi:hypothetical protein
LLTALRLVLCNLDPKLSPPPDPSGRHQNLALSLTCLPLSEATGLHTCCYSHRGLCGCLAEHNTRVPVTSLSVFPGFDQPSFSLVSWLGFRPSSGGPARRRRTPGPSSPVSMKMMPMASRATRMAAQEASEVLNWLFVSARLTVWRGKQARPASSAWDNPIRARPARN